MIKIPMQSSCCLKVVVLCLFLTIVPLHIRCLYSDINKVEDSGVSPHALFRDGGQEDNVYKFEGEFLRYKVGIWIFENAGIASFKCERIGDNIVVTIEAGTAGFLDKLIHRHNTYKTTMKIEGTTNRLIPISSYIRKIKGVKERVMITNYDYVNNVREYKIWKNGEIYKENTAKIDPSVIDDPISVAYNFRNEVYGDIVDGAKFSLSSVYKNATNVLKFNVHDADDSDEYSRWNNIERIKYRVEILLNPDVVDSKKGRIIVLYTENMVPVGFIAKGIIGFGNLYGFRIEEKH